MSEREEQPPATCGAPHCPEVCVEGYCSRKDSAGSYEAACRALAQREPAG